MSIADKLTTVAENVPKVYEAGVEAGQKSEYDRFWDAYQENGNKTYYYQLFCGQGWTNETFKPKYDMKVKYAYGMFWNSKISGDLVGILDDLGIELDFSNIISGDSSALIYVFGNTQFTRIGVCDFSNFVNSSMRFGQLFWNSSKLVTIDKLIVNGHGFDTNGFNGCSALENLTIEGTIGRDSIFNSCSKLSRDSLMSIINALANYSGSGTTYTLTLGTTNLAKLTDAEKAIATEKGWTLA